MMRLMLGATLCVFGLMAAPEAKAQPGPRSGGFVGPARPYHHTHGHRYEGGYYYRGRDHRHWGHRHWDPVHSRYHYYDPYVRSYYYWNPARYGYYPVVPAVRPVIVIRP